MNIFEYNEIKSLSYQEYCNYLQDKYGLSKSSYFTKNWIDSKIKRTNEGLFCHHIREDKIGNLSNLKVAKNAPFEYQEKENLCYCDYLEHLLLHILICEEYDSEEVQELVGIGGIINYLIPQIDIVYKEKINKEKWIQNCYNKILDDEEVYKILRERFLNNKIIQENYNISEEELKQLVDGYLFSHNTSIYKELEEYLEHDNKALVLLGTGLGKTTTTLQYLKQYNCKGLVLCPSNTIVEGWKKYKEVDTMTYQAFARQYKNIDYVKYGVVICDEVHHCGAATWGEGPKYLIDNNIIKVIGLTATPKRTDGIDVGESLFKGNICRGLNVLEGIEQGILHSFSYVGAIYDTGSIKEELEEKEINEELIGELDLAINNTPTIKEIIMSNMPQGNRKGIIFVSNIEAMNEAINIMKDIYPNEEYRCIHIKMSDKEVAENRRWFENTKSGYLCTVNMVSEGAHYRGVNTLIMFRRTCSELVFNQQLGRVISLAKYENPNAIVFDLVNNAKTLKNNDIINILKRRLSIEKEQNIQRITSSQIIIKDYSCEVIEILQKIKIKEKAVICLETQKIYNSLIDAAKETKTNVSNIVNCCKKTRKTTGDYHWTYYNNNINYTKEYCNNLIQEIENNRKIFVRKVICLETQKIYNTINEAEEIFGIKSHISSCCRKKEGCKTAGGYHWSYYDENKEYTKEYCNSLIEEIENSRTIQNKKIVCLETNIIYSSISQAVRENHIQLCSLSRCCAKQQQTAGGYHWSYYDENKEYTKEYCDSLIEEIENSRISLKQKVICLENNIVYDSIASAAKEVNISKPNISACCRGKQQTAGGYHWKYYDENFDKEV